MYIDMYLYFLLCLVSLMYGSCYDLNTANTGVWLSGAAYCKKEEYPTMELSGPANGFQYYETIYDKSTDLLGYTGINSNTQDIFIVFRGSSSMKNWLDDAKVIQVPYTTFPECNCKVHTGFYKSVQNVYQQVHSSVNDILDVYPNYNIIVTGHSYGAAVAQLVAMELLADDIVSTVYNYGQPRIGNKEYAEFVNNVPIDMWRFTHYKDMIPHVPPITGLHYYHSCREVYEDENNNLRICSDTDGEDETCADQFALYQTDTTDHHTYLEHDLDCSKSIQVQTNLHYIEHIQQNIIYIWNMI